jgi:hypothetical protein
LKAVAAVVVEAPESVPAELVAGWALVSASRRVVSPAVAWVSGSVRVKARA